MKKSKINIVLLFAAIALLCSVFSACSKEKPENIKLNIDPPAAIYVGDYADVLSQPTKQHILAKAAALDYLTGAQIVVLTVHFLDGEDIENYAYKVFNKWGIGSSAKNNGLLLLVAIGEDNYWALQGMGIENNLTSWMLGDFLYDYLEADFAAGNYDAGIKKVFDRFLLWFEDFYDIDTATVYDQNGDFVEEFNPSYGGGSVLNSALLTFLTLVVFFGIVIAVIVLGDFIRYRRYRRLYYRPGVIIPPVVYYPFIFGRRRIYGSYRPRPPGGPRRPGGFGGGGTGGSSGGGSRGNFGGGRSSGGGAGRGGFSGGSFGGGRSGGGGAGRR